MALNCGANTSLDSLNEVRDNIKSALAEGKAALGDLQSKVSEATAQFEGLKAEIEENVSSLQEDLQGLSTKFGEEFAAAQSELLEKWGDVVDAAQLDQYVASIPSLDDILSGSASLPDLCTTVENIAVKINEDGTKEKIQKAAAALKPNIKMPEIPKFESVVNDLSTQVSTGNPSSGLTYSTIAATAPLSQTTAYFNGRNARLRQEYEVKIAALKEERQVRRADPLYKSILKKTKDSGLKGAQLQERGLLTTEENDFRVKFITEILDPIRDLKYSWNIVGTLLSAYEDVVATITTEANWLVADSAARNDSRITASDIALLDELYAAADAKADLLIGYANYLGKI